MSKKFNNYNGDFFNKKKFDSYVKDPIHKEISFSSEPWIAEFAFSKEMLRLQEIKQLGVAFKTFTSATHNRYTHCLGTYQVALKFVKKFEQEISIKDKKIFLLAALLHDIGHGPFSHIFEKISKIHHEEMTSKIISSDELSIKSLLQKNKINPESLIDVYSGQCKQEWISKLISSNLDVDRIDYLLRDSYYIGTCYSTIDIDFLIERTELLDADVYFYNSAINYIESFLFGRYYMHLDIYDNKNSYIYEWSLLNVFERLKELKDQFEKNSEKIYYYDLYKWIVFEEEVNIKTYILLNDNNLTCFIDSLKVLNDNILNSFIDNFVYCSGTIVALNYSKENYEKLKDKLKDSDYKISNNYKFHICEKNKKGIYYDGDKNIINIYNPHTKQIVKFPSDKLVQFAKSHKNGNNKIILINKNLIN